MTLSFQPAPSDVAPLSVYMCFLQVHYKKAMPDIEQLMDVWPEEFEEALAKVRLQPPHWATGI